MLLSTLLTDSMHFNQQKPQIFGFPLLKMCHLKLNYTQWIQHQLKNKLDEWRSHIPKSDFTKGIWKWLPKLGDRRCSSKRARDFFLRSTWVSFGTRGMHWSFGAHLTPHGGPERAGGAPKGGGHATVPLRGSVHFLVLSFGLVSSLMIKMTWEFSRIFLEIFSV